MQPSLRSIPSQDLVLVRQGDTPGDPRFTARYTRMVLAAIENGGFADEPVPAAKATLPRVFVRLDADEDGKLSAKELGQAAIAKRQPALFARFDSDKDGFLSADEARKLARRRRR